MRQEDFNEVSNNLLSHFHQKELAEFRVEQALEEKGILLSEDEERLLRAYKKFVCRNSPGAVFKWETPKDLNFVIPEEPSFVLDPRESQ